MNHPRQHRSRRYYPLTISITAVLHALGSLGPGLQQFAALAFERLESTEMSKTAILFVAAPREKK